MFLCFLTDVSLVSAYSSSLFQLNLKLMTANSSDNYSSHSSQPHPPLSPLFISPRGSSSITSSPGTTQGAPDIVSSEGV